MRPFRSFLLLLIFLICFTGLYYVIPGHLNLPGINYFLPGLFTGEVPVQKDTSLIIQNVRRADSVKKHITNVTGKNLHNVLPVNTKFPQYISRYFDSLESRGQQIRIMYYGDSQLEGDRITSYLRWTLRRRYGGTGPGLLLPLMPVMYTKTVYIRSSSNWERYNYLSFRDGTIKTKSLGPFMTVCRFLPPGKISPTREKANVRIVPSQFADSSASQFDYIRIFYGNTPGKVNMVTSIYGIRVFSDTLAVGPGLHELRHPVGKARDINIEFEGNVSPDIYGISIESYSGIQVDNIPQRGSAGFEFTMVDRNNLKDSYKLLSPDLFILQYGLNIVRDVRSDYTFYENGMLNQLKRIKELCPGVPILVLGLTDMAYIEGDSIRSFPNITKIIEAQRRATERAGEYFWDTWAAMGGKLSIVRWANKNPPLAQNDYVHFTYNGADTLSSLLVNKMLTFSGTVNKSNSGLARTLISSRGNGVAKDSSVVRVSDNRVNIKSIISKVFTYDPADTFIFTTPGFWIFLLLVLAGYSVVYRKKARRNFYLFIISLYFYFKTGGLFLFLLIFITVVDYTCGLLIHRSKTRFKRKFLIIISLVSNLSLLAYFKYAAFITDVINNLFGTQIRVYDILSDISNFYMGTSFDTSFIILPVGISFFTFQSLSYTIDVYRNRMKPVRNIIDFGFYVSFFPHLVAGPIVRASVFMPQIYREFSLKKREFSHALFLITKGLLKKIIISNFIAVSFVDRVFEAPALFSGFENLMAVYGYGLQIYCDFSGYTDIAIGVALILGFRLPVNFNSPYKASSIADFWRRWHISLSTWLRDYLYISLGGNRKGRLRTLINLMITMLLGGLWHGAALRYVIWGGLHGIGLVINKGWNFLFRKSDNLKWLSRAIGIFLTFNFVNFCWIFFRAETFNDSLIMIRQIWNSFSPGSYMDVLPAYSKVFILMLTGYLIHFIPEQIKESYRGLFIRMPVAVQLTFIMLIAIVLYQVRSINTMPFIYFRF